MITLSKNFEVRTYYFVKRDHESSRFRMLGKKYMDMLN